MDNNSQGLIMPVYTSRSAVLCNKPHKARFIKATNHRQTSNHNQVVPEDNFYITIVDGAGALLYKTDKLRDALQK